MIEYSSKYVSDTDIHLYKQKVFEILCDFTAFLEKNNIRYMLAFGTLLGAIRHRGFIPWDDDVDIIISNKDFNKLMGIIKEFENEKYICVSPFENSPVAVPRLMKIYDRSVCIKEYGNRCYEGAFIDVFTMINISDKWSIKTQCGFYRLLTTALMIKNGRIDVDHAVTGTAKLISYLTYPIKKEWLNLKIRQYYRTINSNNGLFACSSGLVEEVYERDFLDDLILHDFEGKKFYIPKEFDELLTKTYGDYMKLPPIEKRVPHHLQYINFDENFEIKNKELNN